MNHLKRIILILLPVLIISCEKKAEWDLQEEPGTALVVDGIITNEFKIQQIQLSHPVADPNAIPEGVSGADIIITAGDSVYHFHGQNGTPGTYVSDRAFAGEVDKEHSLLITLEGNVYSAKAVMDPTPASVTLPGFTFDAGKGKYSLTSVADQYDPAFPSMYEISLDWSAVPGYQGGDADTTHARIVYYVLPTLDVSEILPPTAETVYFPPGTSVIMKKYSLTREHAEFARALLSETKWQGGYFSSASANVPTNLSQGARGYFGACAVVVKEGTVGE